MKFATFLILSSVPLAAHDIITTPITWGHEISTIIEKHCVSCHSPYGNAFPLLAYKDVRPWAVAIREEVLKRTMPPWGAVKGFGDFSNDNSLTPEEIELIVKWTEGGVPEGEAKELTFASQLPPVRVSGPVRSVRSTDIKVTGTYRLKKPIGVESMYVSEFLPTTDARIIAKLPDGSIQPLLWLKDYESRFAHSFDLRAPLSLPAGTIIEGVPKGMTLVLIPILLEGN